MTGWRNLQTGTFIISKGEPRTSCDRLQWTDRYSIALGRLLAPSIVCASAVVGFPNSNSIFKKLIKRFKLSYVTAGAGSNNDHIAKRLNNAWTGHQHTVLDFLHFEGPPFFAHYALQVDYLSFCVSK